MKKFFILFFFFFFGGFFFFFPKIDGGPVNKIEGGRRLITGITGQDRLVSPSSPSPRPRGLRSHPSSSHQHRAHRPDLPGSPQRRLPTAPGLCTSTTPARSTDSSIHPAERITNLAPEPCAGQLPTCRLHGHHGGDGDPAAAEASGEVARAAAVSGSSRDVRSSRRRRTNTFSGHASPMPAPRFCPPNCARTTGARPLHLLRGIFQPRISQRGIPFVTRKITAPAAASSWLDKNCSAILDAQRDLDFRRHSGMWLRWPAGPPTTSHWRANRTRAES